MDAALAAAVGEANEAYRKAASIMRSLVAQPGDVAFYKAAFVATILDGLSATIALVEQGAHSYVDVIGRSMLEALGDLNRICDDPAYLKTLQLESAKKTKASAQEYIRQSHHRPDVQYIVDLAKRRAKEANDSIERIYRDGQPPPALVDKGEQMGLEEELQAVYGMSSFETHNDLSALDRRHRRANGIAFGARDVDRALSALQGALVVTATALATAHSFSQVSDVAAAMVFIVLEPHVEAIQREIDIRNAQHTGRTDPHPA